MVVFDLRAELGPAETATHLKRRKELWEQRSGKTSPTAGGGAPGDNTGFATDTEDKTGTSKRTINQAIARATDIPPDVMAKITSPAPDSPQPDLASAGTRESPGRRSRCAAL